MNKKGLLLVATTAVISGFSIFINKYGVAFSNPYVFTFLKNILVAVFLTALVTNRKNITALFRLTRKQWIKLILIGLIGGSIPFLLFFKGLSLVSAAQGSFTHKTMFVYTAVLAVIFLREKINREFVIGGLFLILANALILKGMNVSFGWGDFLILMATIFWAIENVLSKHTLGELDGKTVAWGRMFFGSIFLLLFLILDGQFGNLANLDLKQVGWIGLTSVLLLGYVLTWYSGLKLVPVSVATPILLLGFPITSALSFFSTGSLKWSDLISVAFLLGGIVCIAGVGFVTRSMQNLKKKHGWS